MTTPHPGTILVVDDDEDILTTARILLKRQGWDVRTERGPRNLEGLLAERSFDVILLDMNFTRNPGSGEEGFAWLKTILELDRSAVVILITAYGDVEMAVRAIKEGAVDFVMKPWQNEKLIATVSAAMELRRSHLEVEKLRSTQETLTADLGRQFGEFLGESKPMQRVFETIRKVAATDANVLIFGENGTGKELAARELHRLSERAREVFVAVDMGALTSSLFESELFGHVRGAFTDARADRAGRFEVASGGTLFLDEIGNLPLELQAKLMSVLQNREVTRIGSNATRSIDIRLVCASNVPLRDLVAAGKFREDLFYRINTVELELPPLRDRSEDIPLLAGYFLRLYSAKYRKPATRLGAQTLRKLERYHWPGNVRELQHAVERAVILCESSTLEPVDFYFNPAERSESITVRDFKLDEVERSVILKAITKHRGNISQAAKELGLTRAALYRRLGKHGL
jgi:two-component system, NtrC family, response regulator HydG